MIFLLVLSLHAYSQDMFRFELGSSWWLLKVHQAESWFSEMVNELYVGSALSFGPSCAGQSPS